MIDRESKSEVTAALAINWNILVELVNVLYVPTVARQDTKSLGVMRLSATHHTGATKEGGEVDVVVGMAVVDAGGAQVQDVVDALAGTNMQQEP